MAILYHQATEDAEDTKQGVEAEGLACLLTKGDIGKEAFCKRAVEKVAQKFGRLDVLVNNAAEQHPQGELAKITEKQLVATCRTNILSQSRFWRQNSLW